MKQFFEEFKARRDNDDNDVKYTNWDAEKGIIKSYNGRQLFELLQNIDDAKSKKALIKIDTKNKLLFVANKGLPFSENGLKSLMMAHLSPKDKTFIGNKGLGFRSLFNWLGEIYVKSENLSIEFSKENRKRQEEKENSKRSISSTPEWIDSENPREWIDKINFDKEYITYIVIHYRDDVEDEIIHQIDELSEEVMYFINNIEEIIIEKDNEPKKILKKKNWDIKTKEDLIPKKYQENEDDEDEYYQLKIILPPKNEKVSPFLFSYFPTKIKINFPALIHGTFDLNSSRVIIDDDIQGKNRFIIKKLAEFIIEVTESLKEENANWKAYEFVNIKHKNEILESFGFYKIIEEWKKTAKIYPCIDNIYRNRNDWKFYGKNFSTFMENHSEVVGDILKNLPPFACQYIFHDDIVGIFNKISRKKLSIDDRINFIKNILDLKYRKRLNFKGLILLINQDKKLKEELFFYDDIFINLEIPSFIEIDYIYPDLQKELTKDELYKIANIKKFDIQKDLINEIIESDKTLQEKLQALYPLRKFDKPSKSLKGITDKYIRDERILKIFDKEEIIEDYNTLGINCLKEIDNFLIWLGAKRFNAQQILRIVVYKNNKKQNIPSTLKSLFILKDEFSKNVDNKKIRTDKDIFVLNANNDIVEISNLFPYNQDCKNENIIADKKTLGLGEYSDKEVQEFLEWIGIKEFNPQNIAIEKIKQLRKKDLDKEEAKEIFQFLNNARNSNQIPDIKPETSRIYIFNILSKNLFFRTELTEKYFNKNELLFPYSELGFDDNKESQEFFKWLGVKEADNNLIVEKIFKSKIETKEKLKELFALFKEDDSIVRPNIKIELHSLTGEKKDVKELYINNDITRFCKKEKVVDIPLYEYSEAFFKWLKLQEPTREKLVKQLLNHLSNKTISIDNIQDILNLLSEKYQEFDNRDRNKPLYIFNDKKEKLKNYKIYQNDELALKYIPNDTLSKELVFDEKFLWWLGIKKAKPFEIIKTLLKKEDKNLKDIFELWKQDSEIKPLPKNISVKLLNRKNEEILANKLFFKDDLTPFYDDSELIANYIELGLDNSSKSKEFLVWLGVNKYIKYIDKKDYQEVYKIKEIAKLEFKQLFALIEVENILEKGGALREIQKEHASYNYWIIHNYGIPLINPPIEYENNPKRINLLKQLGVKEDFEKENSLFLLKKLHKIDENGRFASSIYKEIINKNFNFLNESFLIFTKNKEYKNNLDLYYLSTSKHPKNILNKYEFIDLPINLDINQVYNTFAIDEVADIQYTIKDFEEIDSKLFDKYFEDIKPYLLAFGSIGIKEIRQKENLANQLKSLQIKLGNFICFADGKEVELEEFEMIKANQTFHIKCKNAIIPNFSKNGNLTDSIENILLTIEFTNHNKFRDIFRYGDFEELEKILSEKYGSTVLEDAKVLLGKVQKIEEKAIPSDELFDNNEKLKIAQKEFKEVLAENYKLFEQNLYIWCQKQHQEKKFISLIDKYNNIKINTIEDIDYKEYIIKYVKDNFYFSISAIDEYINIQEIFTKNKELVDSDKIIHIERYRSLLYFEGKLDEIKEYIKSLKNKKPSSENTENEDDSSSTITDVNLTPITTNGGTRGGSSGGTWKPPVSSDSPQVGFTSEERVYNKLVREFGTENVHWSSNGISDSYGYDIWYKNKKNEIKYVEVKTFSNKGRFYISPNEVKFAKDNKDSYELYLVDKSTIYRVKNFHKLKKIIENYTVRFNAKDLRRER